MTIKQLYNSGILELPIKRPVGLSFQKFVTKKFNEFQKKIGKLNLPPSVIYPDMEKAKITGLIAGINSSIFSYLQGNPQEAFNGFKKSLDDNYVYNSLLYNRHPKAKNLYRLRVKESNYLLPKNELFHVPFDKRQFIGNQRYSISGYPCLYVSNAVYVAWEEMRRPKLNDLQAIRLRTTKQIKYLDLSTDIFSKEYDTDGEDENFLIQQLMAWPLFAACSIKVLEDSAPFKPEYIIPQLLLQWVKEGKQDGIKFSSTHIDLNATKTSGRLYNIVLPVKSIKDSKHCTALANFFEFTEVLSWQLNEVSTGGTTFWYTDDPINDEVEHVEIVKGKSFPYNYSALAKLERNLNDLPLNKL